MVFLAVSCLGIEYRGAPAINFSLAGAPLSVFEVFFMYGPDLVEALLNLLFFPFSLSDNSLFLVVFGVFLFCFSFVLIKRLMRSF